MTDEEVNKIIAEFNTDAGHSLNNLKPRKYTESLDALVPVWVKMSVDNGDGVWINFARHGVEDYHMAFFRHRDEDYDYADCVDASPQQVAAHATARAILELKNE